jgi:hypothetical protein
MKRHGPVSSKSVPVDSQPREFLIAAEGKDNRRTLCGALWAVSFRPGVTIMMKTNLPIIRRRM